MPAVQETKTAPTALEVASDFLEKVYARASQTVYGKSLGSWVNPAETKGEEYVAARDSVISDVIQKSSLYLPGLDAKRKYYREQVGVFVPSVEAAARSWAVDDLQNQVPKLVNLLLAAKSRAENLHLAAQSVRKTVNAKDFVLPVMTSEEIREVTNEARKSSGTVTTRLERFSYMYVIRGRRSFKANASTGAPEAAKAKPGRDDTYDYLFYLMAHPRGVRIVDEFAKSAEKGWQYTSDTISESLTAITKTVASLNSDQQMVWHFPSAISAGVAKLGMANRSGLTRFSLAWATTEKGWLESAIDTAMNAIFVLDLVGGPIGAEVASVLNFVLAAIGTAVSFLKDVEQDQAASATAFAGKSEKLSEGSRGIGTILQGVATLVAATALPGAVSRITGSVSKTGERVLETVEHVPPARQIPDPRALNPSVEERMVGAERRGLSNPRASKETSTSSVAEKIGTLEAVAPESRVLDEEAIELMLTDSGLIKKQKEALSRHSDPAILHKAEKRVAAVKEEYKYVDLQANLNRSKGTKQSEELMEQRLTSTSSKATGSEATLAADKSLADATSKQTSVQTVASNPIEEYLARGGEIRRPPIDPATGKPKVGGTQPKQVTTPRGQLWKEHLGEGLEERSIQPGTRSYTGMAEGPEHHVLPKDPRLRPWFNERGIGKNEIHKVTVKLDKWEHEAIHVGGDWAGAKVKWEKEWNRNMMKELFAAEAKKGSRLRPREIWDIAYQQVRKYNLPREFVPYSGPWN